jgi:2-polyprenyl-3-methyl-5-hydroxy-6-metoxy-1,4-benzoquinol methylase
MTGATSKREQVKDFWNSRAAFQALAGTNDFTAKRLEHDTILKHVRDGQRVLEIGCGNGLLSIEMAEKLDVSIDAFDFAAEMIADAKERAKSAKLRGTINFDVRDVRDDAMPDGNYDVAITERVVINLLSWEEQADAIAKIVRHLKPGGHFLMCENSATGLARLNELRALCGLEPVIAPWHNRYFNDAEVAALRIPGVELVEVIPYSATYYFVSRVVNAWNAKMTNTALTYDSPINQLGLILPAIGDTAQGKLWIFKRTA